MMNAAEKRAELEDLARRRTVKGWAFRGLPAEENENIRRFLDGGICPSGYQDLYALCREQLKLGPKDWYEAYGEAVHSLGREWPTVLTVEEEVYCEAAADSIAVRPGCEK